MVGSPRTPTARPQQGLRSAPGSLALALLALAVLPAAGVLAAPVLGEDLLPAEDYLNADGLPLMMPNNRTTFDHTWYYEVPRNPGAPLLTHGVRAPGWLVTDWLAADWLVADWSRLAGWLPTWLGVCWWQLTASPACRY